MGDFVLLKALILKKNNTFLWGLFGWCDSLCRGFGQVVFANNPISGIMIMIALALTAPGILVAAVGTGFFGLLLSLLLRDTGDNIDNGLTVFNPVLIGAVTYASAPRFYGAIDAFAVLIIVVGTIFSVYLTRSLGTGRFPCLTAPYNIVEPILLLVLTMQRDFGQMSKALEIVTMQNDVQMENSTEFLFVERGLINETLNLEKLNWGLVFRGVVTSASQLYAVDDVAAASVIYLSIIVYSPLTALFSFLGALVGSLVALSLNVPLVSVYAGLWGYNSFLTGGAFGGLFLVISGQTAAVAFVAIIFTTLLQYVGDPLMAKVGLPVLTIPFVVTAWLFFGLRDSVDGTFPRPALVTFPEHELHSYRLKGHELDLEKIEENSDAESPNAEEKISSND
ncbi:urea transporter 2-like isoform X2 [Venturia canescens]|nr:urea transporter 2-like isoform X2 [Venturia canescens]